MRPPFAWLATLLALCIAAPARAQDDDEDDPVAEAPEETPEETQEEAPPAPPPAPAPGEEPVASQAAADEPTAAVADEELSYPRFELNGYARGGFGFRVRPDALPKDELDYGFNGLGGIGITGWAHRMWRARLIMELRSDAFSATTIDGTFDFNSDGIVDAFTFTDRDVPGVAIEHATAAFVPTDWFSLEAGILRIPFTLQQQSKNTQLMFPSRSSANLVFLSGADIGALARGDFWDGTLVTSIGAFNGDSFGLALVNTEARGVVLSFRTDVNPFGAFDSAEGDLTRGPFRLGVGFGTTLRPATIYDARTGTEPRSVFDVRLAGSLRLAWRGLYIAAEYFRRQQDDNFSFRPEVADGAYGQIAYLIAFSDSVGLEPIARAGFVAADQTFDPRITGYIDAGFNFYPVLDAMRGDEPMPDAVKLTLLYLGERRFSEQEEAHGAAGSLQVKF